MGNIPQCSIALNVESLVFMKKYVQNCFLKKLAGPNQSEYAEH